MLEQNQNEKKRGLTFIGILYIAYYAIVVCKNTPMVLRVGFVLVAGLIILDKLLSSERTKIVFPRACGMLFYFFAYCFFSRIWAEEPALASRSTSFFVSLFCLVVVMVNYFVKIRSTKACIYAVIVCGITLGLYVVIKNGGLSGFYQSAMQEGTRISADEKMNPNTVGMTCMFSVIALLYYAIVEKKRFFYLMSVFPLVIALASGSRKAILLLAVGLVVLVLLSQKDRKGVIKYLKLIALLLVVILALQVILSLEMMSTARIRMEKLFSTISGDALNMDGSAANRIKMMRIGLEQFKETPFLGLGMEGSNVLNWREMRLYTYSHSDYIEHLVNGGIFGFILYYGIIFYLGKRLLKLMKVCDKPELKLSITIMAMLLVMNVAAVTYYNRMETYLYFTLWISEVAICEKELREKELKESVQKTGENGAS